VLLTVEVYRSVKNYSLLNSYRHVEDCTALIFRVKNMKKGVLQDVNNEGIIIPRNGGECLQIDAM
jgi:hypothetical protein